MTRKILKRRFTFFTISIGESLRTYETFMQIGDDTLFTNKSIFIFIPLYRHYGTYYEIKRIKAYYLHSYYVRRSLGNLDTQREV